MTSYKQLKSHQSGCYILIETFKKLNDIVLGLNYFHYTNLVPFSSILTLNVD